MKNQENVQKGLSWSPSLFWLKTLYAQLHIAQRLQTNIYGLEISLVDRIEKLEYSTDSTDVRPPTS